jgi:ATP-dependent DNA helicase PIF1
MLSIKQEYGIEKFKNGSNIFITGPGGSGKTFFIKKILQLSHSDKIQICALTGCATILLQAENEKASTIHSWSGVGIGKGEWKDILKKIKKNREIKNRWLETSILVIDEISMMSGELLELLNYVAQNLRKSEKIFGGIQVVFSGDFFQLPPFNNEKFCFESPLWKKLFHPDCCIEFDQIFRQSDNHFQNILNEIRIGKLSASSETILRKHLHRRVQNQNVLTKIFPLRKKVDDINNFFYSKIKEEEQTYTLYQDTTSKHYVSSNLPIPSHKLETINKGTIQKEVAKLIKDNACSPLLSLKKDCPVMCLVNLDVENGICNGSQGIVIRTDPDGPTVRFLNGLTLKIPLQFYQSKEYPSIVIGQYPLVLSWAMTIHKVQGATLDAAEMDIGSGIFTYGQSYVALSRLRSLEGLYLKAFSRETIKAHPKVVEFYKQFS